MPTDEPTVSEIKAAFEVWALYDPHYNKYDGLVINGKDFGGPMQLVIKRMFAAGYRAAACNRVEDANADLS